MLRTGARKCYVIGVGMTKFEKPGRRDNFDYPDMAKESVSLALKDAKIRCWLLVKFGVHYLGTITILCWTANLKNHNRVNWPWL